MPAKSISVVLPIYNEEANISDVINAIFNTLPSVTDDFEIIAVDDGSFDSTLKILGALKFSNSQLKIIHHEKNKGYGAALASGFKNSEKEFILMMDSDRQFDISEIKKLISYTEDFDIVSGFRIQRNDSFYRFLLGACFNFITNVMFGINTKDINCGFKLFKTGLIRSFSLTTKGALINAEIMALANKNKAKIKEVGVRHYPRLYGRQTGASFKVILKGFLEILQLKWRLLKNTVYLSGTKIQSGIII